MSRALRHVYQAAERYREERGMLNAADCPGFRWEEDWYPLCAACAAPYWDHRCEYIPSSAVHVGDIFGVVVTGCTFTPSGEPSEIPAGRRREFRRRQIQLEMRQALRLLPYRIRRAVHLRASGNGKAH